MSTSSTKLSDQQIQQILDLNEKKEAHDQSPSSAWIVARMAEEIQAHRAKQVAVDYVKSIP